MINTYNLVKLGGVVLPMCNIEIKNTPVYTEYENVFYSKINILRGWKVSCEITAHYLSSSENKTLYENVTNIIDEISSGISRNLTCFNGESSTLVMTIPLNNLDSDIMLNDYVRGNSTIGFILKLKLSNNTLFSSPFLWDSSIVNWTLAVNTLIDDFRA